MSMLSNFHRLLFGAGLSCPLLALLWVGPALSRACGRWSLCVVSAGQQTAAMQACMGPSQLLPSSVLQFPWISYSDLWTLAGCVAIEEMGGGFPPAGMAIRWCLRPACSDLLHEQSLQLPSHSRPAIVIQGFHINWQPGLNVHLPLVACAQHTTTVDKEGDLVSGILLHLSGIAGSGRGPGCQRAAAAALHCAPGVSGVPCAGPHIDLQVVLIAGMPNGPQSRLHSCWAEMGPQSCRPHLD